MERFGMLAGIEGLRHGFVGRVPGVEVKVEREVALERLWPVWRGVLAEEGVGELWTAEQTHGDGVAVVGGGVAGAEPGVDGLVTAEAGVTLGIVVADCCAVFLVDPDRRVCGLVHSGRKGSELGIVGKAVEVMRERFGCDPADLVVVLSPCIRPPAYEVDVAGMVVESCLAAGVSRESISDDGVCTHADAGRYYSYRREKGKTGRMLAFLGFA